VARECDRLPLNLDRRPATRKYLDRLRCNRLRQLKGTSRTSVDEISQRTLARIESVPSEIDRLKRGHSDQCVRKHSFKAVGSNIKDPRNLQIAEAIRHRANEMIPVKIELFEIPKVTQFGRNLARELVGSYAQNPQGCERA